MARRSTAVKRALPTRDCEAIEQRVETLTKNLLQTGKVIGLRDGSDLMRLLYDEVDIPRVQDAYSYFTHAVNKDYSVSIDAFQHAGRMWDVKISANTWHPLVVGPKGRETYGVIKVQRTRVPRLPSDRLPVDLHEMIAAHVIYRYRIGIEVGICRKIVKDVLDRLSSPMQVLKVWPELLQYSVGSGERLDEKLYKLQQRKTTRVVMPHFWNNQAAPAKDGTPMTVGQRYMAAIRAATMTLTKCAVLSDADNKVGLYHTSVALLGAEAPVAPWDGKPIPIA
jgi:hypothetical protein